MTFVDVVASLHTPRPCCIACIACNAGIARNDRIARIAAIARNDCNNCNDEKTDEVLALLDPGVQAIQPLDGRLHRLPFLAIGPSRPVRDGAELLLSVPGSGR